MNTINFQETGGFPLETDTLNFMQEAYKGLQVISNLGGENYILSGCIVQSSNVTDGYLVINGEVLSFRGGLKQPKVTIIENTQKRPFENGTIRDVFTTRYATFGTGEPSFNFEDFKRFKGLADLTTEVAGKALASNVDILTAKVAELEKKAAPFASGGGVVLWNKPANLIPPGWAEVIEMRGRTPFGYDPDDLKFYPVGTGAGRTEFTIVKENLPRMEVRTGKYYAKDMNHNGDYLHGSFRLGAPFETIASFGVDFPAPINLLNPYRVVMFIKYEG